MPYNFAADSFQTKKLGSRLSSSEVLFFTQIGRFAFFRPPLGGLRGNVLHYMQRGNYRVLRQMSFSQQVKYV